jgi:mRNA-decapping enzyme subunit 2
VINDQSVRLYLIPGVPEDTKFSPKSRCEIKDIRWFDINQLPLVKSDQVSGVYFIILYCIYV